MLLLQSDLQEYQLQQPQRNSQPQLQFQQQLQGSKASFSLDRNEAFVYHSDQQQSASWTSIVKASQSLDHRQVDDNLLLNLAHQKYKAGNCTQALELSNSLYERHPLRTDNLPLLGAIYYQLHDFDACISKKEETLRIDPHFAECYGNMANVCKEKGNVDLAIH